MEYKIPHYLSKSSGIYIIRNTINHKIYVGSAVLLIRRYRQHKHRILSGIHQSRHLLHHVSKYGINTLSFELLEKCPTDLLIAREQHYLDTLRPFVDNGFNTSEIAGATVGVKHTEYTKKIMSECRKGKKLSEETKRRMSAAQQGRKMSPESIEKMKRAQSNKSYGPEARRNMSIAHVGQKQSQETKDKRAASLRGKTKNGMIVLNTATGIFYDSIKEAALLYGIVHTTLHRKITGRIKNNTPFRLA
jgi:group I intron endonuclease